MSPAAFAGVTSLQEQRLGLTPELTTNGSYPKAWWRIGGELYLFKAGSYLFFNGANEDCGPCSEYFAAQAAEAAGLEHVNCDLKVWKGHMASVCHLFNSKDYAYIPFCEATGYGKLLETLAIAAMYSESLLAGLLKILAFDAIIANDDRHAGNYGFLRDSHTGEYVGLASIFDNNRALFPTAMPADCSSFGEKAAGMYPAGSDSTFSYLLKTRFTTDDSHRIAKRLLTFRFKQYPKYRFDQERLDALSEMVQARAAFALDCPARDIEEIAGWLKQSEAAKAIDSEKVPLFVQKSIGTHTSDAKHKLQP